MSESCSDGKVLVIDDHPLVREALRSVLGALFDPLDFHGAGCLDEGLALVGRSDFDLILLDLYLPGAEGLSALLALRALAPATPTVIVSQLDDEDTVRNALACGAAGFVPKALPREGIIAALRCVIEGGVYAPARAGAPAEAGGSLHGLTPRQIVVFEHLLQGHSNKLIAYELDISEWTVKAHVSAILRALQVHSRVEAVLAAKRLGLAPRG